MCTPEKNLLNKRVSLKLEFRLDRKLYFITLRIQITIVILQVWFSNRRARLRKHAGNTNPAAALSFASLPLSNMACQYTADGGQHDWRNSHFVNYNMLQQSSFNPSHQDVSRTDYSAIFDANYAMAQAQVAQVHAAQAQVAQAQAAHAQANSLNNLNSVASRVHKETEQKELAVGNQENSQATTSWNKTGEWSQLPMNLQPENLSYNVNDVFAQSQYSVNAAKSYWA